MKVYVLWSPIYQEIRAVYREKKEAEKLCRWINEGKSMMFKYSVDEVAFVE